MSIIYEQRSSSSAYVQSVARGLTTADGHPIRPAENHWHMVAVKHNGGTRLVLVGPWTDAGVAAYLEGAEILWIKFKLGAFMPNRPIQDLRNAETVLPDASSRSFWFHGSAWQYPDFEHAETFVDWLVQAGLLAFDPCVNAVLQDETPNAASRTVRHRFQQATGLSWNHIRQVERAQRAAALLERGVSISDTAFELGYFDQPHLTRAVKRWIGHTPGQLIRPQHL